MLPHQYGVLDINRAGVRLLLGDANLREILDQHLGFDFELPGKLVDSNLIRFGHLLGAIGPFQVRHPASVRVARHLPQTPPRMYLLLSLHRLVRRLIFRPLTAPRLTRQLQRTLPLQSGRLLPRWLVREHLRRFLRQPLPWPPRLRLPRLAALRGPQSKLLPTGEFFRPSFRRCPGFRRAVPESYPPASRSK